MEIINHECYVSLEIAKLLKEAGFDWEVNTCRYNSSPDKISSNGTLTSNFNGYAFQHIAISAPTLDVAQKWLREVKKYHIYVRPYDLDDGTYVTNIVITDSRWGSLQDNNKKAIIFKTYEEAQEAGIKKALEIILEKGE